MLNSSKPTRSLIAAAAIVWGVAFGTAAGANTITITPDPAAGNPNPATVTSTQAGNVFEGLVDNVGFTFTAATGFLFAGSPASEAALLTAECACGQTFTASGGVDDPGSTLTIAAEWFSIKADGWIAFFHNVSGGVLNLTYADALGGGNAADISHTTYFVPFPVVGAGLPGLVLACGGLLGLARRRRRQAAFA